MWEEIFFIRCESADRGLQVQWIKSRYMSFAVIHKQSRFKGLHKPRLILCSPYLLLNSFIMFIPASIININNRPMRSHGFAMSLDDYCIDRKLYVHFASYYALHNSTVVISWSSWWTSLRGAIKTKSYDWQQSHVHVLATSRPMIGGLFYHEPLWFVLRVFVWGQAYIFWFIFM